MRFPFVFLGYWQILDSYCNDGTQGILEQMRTSVSWAPLTSVSTSPSPYQALFIFHLGMNSFLMSLPNSALVPSLCPEWSAHHLKPKCHISVPSSLQDKGQTLQAGKESPRTAPHPAPGLTPALLSSLNAPCPSGSLHFFTRHAILPYLLRTPFPHHVHAGNPSISFRYSHWRTKKIRREVRADFPFYFREHNIII